MFRSSLCFILITLGAATASAWGARSPEERGGTTRRQWDANTGSYRDVNCNHGMTGRGSPNHAMNRLGNDMIRAANAAGVRQPATGNGNYDDRMSRAIDYMMKNRLSKSRGKCALYVRRGLASAGLVPNVPLGHANAYVNSLKRHCFQNLIGRFPTPESAPAGAILVYKGINTRADKNAKYGHVEVRTSIGYVSDYFSSNPRTGRGSSGRNRQLIGVMIKPNGGDYRSCR